LERIEKAKKQHEESKDKISPEDRLKRERAIAKEIADFKKAIIEKK
jgi:hypothetical protein